MNKEWFKLNAPTILTGLGCIGTVVTAGLAVRAGMKIADICSDEEVNKKEVAKACVPIAVSCGITLGCTIASDILNRGQKSDLLAMCSLAGSSYSAYRAEVIKRYGSEVDKEITDTVAEHAEVMYMAPEIPDKLCHWTIDMCTDGVRKYEIDAYERDIIHAEMHLNRNFVLQGEQSYANFLDFLGIKVGKFDSETIYGWGIYDGGIYFIDFIHEKIGENEFLLRPIFAPWYGYDRYDSWGNEY